MSSDTEQKLRESEEKYRRLFEAAKDGIIILDFDTGLIVDVNKFLIDLLEYSFEDLLKKHLWDIGIFKDVAASKEAFAELQNKEFIRYENLPLETKSGKKMAVEFVSNVYLVGRKKVIQCNIRDITERINAEETVKQLYTELEKRVAEADSAAQVLKSSRRAALNLMEDATEARKRADEVANTLRETKDYLDKLIKYASAPIIVWDPEMLVTQFNRGFEKLTGCMESELLGENVGQLFPEESREASLKKIGVALMGAQMEEMEIPILCKNGSVKTVLWNSANIYAEDGATLVATIAQGTDITERKQAEETIRRAKEEWERTFDSVPDLITVMDTDHRIIRVNNALAKRLHKTPKECVGRHCYDIVHGTIAPPFFCPHQAMLKDHKEHADEIHEKNLGGDFLVTVTPLLDREGKMFGSVHVARDITEQKKKEAELYKLNRTLTALTRSSKAMGHAQDEAGYLRDVCAIVTEECGHAMVWIGFAENDAAKSVRPVASAGFEEGYLETLKLTWADTERGQGPTGTAIRTGKISQCKDMLNDPKFRPWREEAIKRGYASSIVLPLFEGRKAFGAITIYSKKTDAFSEDETKLLSELANDLTYGIRVMRLRAARAEAEETLRRERNFSNAVIQTTGGLIVGLDGHGRIVLFNHACEKTTGYKFDEVKGRPFWDFLLLPEEKAPVQKVFKEIMEGAVSAYVEFENYWIAKDGSRRYIRWANSSLKDDDGKVMLVLGTGIDITELMNTRRNIENLNAFLKQKADELTSANQDLEAFASSVAHDLRNPLHAIGACLDVIGPESRARLGDDDREALLRVGRSARRMTDVIADLLVLSRVSREELHREKTDLSGMAKKIIDELKTSAPERNVRTDIAPSAVADADPGAVRIMMENILGNAWKYTSRTSRAHITFGVRKDPKGEVYFVRDNGAGFSQADAKRLFKPFQRLHSDKEFPGTGIGLATAKRIVDKHGGTIWAEAEAGKGATFYFSFSPKKDHFDFA